MRKIIFFTLLLTVSIFMSGCQLPARDQEQPAASETIPLLNLTEPQETSMEEGELVSTETSMPPTESATETLTATPTETLTPTETTTPTPEYTATETVPPTPDPEQGLGDILFEDRFDGSSGWGWTYIEEGVVSFGLDSGGVLAEFKDSNQGWRISLGPDAFSAGDQRAQLTAKALSCGEQDEWGLLYRSEFTTENKFNGYIYKINCAGQIRVEKLEDNQSSILLGWVSAEGAETGDGSENTLMIWAFGEEMRFYVNGIFVDTVIDPNYGSGEYGIYAQDRTDGDAEFLFTNFQVYDVEVE